MTSNGPEDFAQTEEFTSEFVPTSNDTPEPSRPKFSWEEDDGPSSIVTTTSTLPGAPKPSPAEPVSETAKKFEDSGKIDALALRKALIDHEEQRSSYQKSIDGWLGKTGLLNPDEAAKAAQAERETAIASQSRWTEAKKWYDEQRKSGAANAVDLGAIGNAIADYNPLALVSNATVDFVGTKLGRNIEDAKKRQAEADAIIEGKKDPFVQEIWRNTFENSAKGVVNSLASSTIKSVGYGYGFAKQAIGLTSDATDNSVYATGAAIEKWAEKTFPTDPARKEEWSSVVGQGAGSMLGLLTPAIGAKVVAQFGPRILYSATKGSMGLPALAEGATLAERTIEASRLAASGNIWAGRTVGITGAMTTSAEMSDEYVKHQKAKGEPVDPRKLVGLYAMGLGIGYTERLSIDAVLNRHGGSILAAGLVQMVEEGGQEFASQIMQNVAAIGMYDDKRHWDDNAWTGAAVGAILGGAMGGSSALMGKMGNKWDGDPEAPQVTTGDVNAKMKTVAPAAAIPAVPMASAPAKPDPLQPVAPGASPAPAVAAPITTGMDPAVLEELRQIDPEFAAEAERIAKVSTGTKTDVSPAATSEVPPTQPQDAPAIQPMLDGPSQPGEAGRTSVTTRTTGAPSIPDEIMAILRQTNPEMARKYESTPEQPNVNISTSELMFGRQPGNEGSPEKLVQTLSKFSALDLFRVAEANGLQVTEDGRPLAQLPANELVDGIVSATAAKMRSRSAVVSRGGLVQESIPAAVQVDEPQEETVVRLEDELPAIAADIEQFMIDSGINDVLSDPEFRAAAQQVLDGIDLAAAVAGTIAARSQTASQAAPELSANIPAQNAENADAQVEPAVRGYPQFVEMLAGKTPASKWASEMGVDQASLDGLIQQALLDGRLSMVGGKPRRTPKAKVLPDAPLQDAPQAVVKESRTTEAPAAPRPTLTRAEEKRLEAVKDELAYTHAKRLLDTQSDAGQFADALKTLRSDKKLTKAKMAEVFKAYTGSRKAPPKTKPKAIEALKTVRDQRAKKMATAPIAQPVIPVARPVETISITTPYGDMEIAGQVEIVDISTLKKATGSLQPRDRSRAESQETIRAIASKLDPAQLMPSRVSDSGAPIVAADGTVISGNGRVEAIRQVYANADLASRAQAYREAIGDAGGIAQPVKIVRLPAMSRAELERFADLSNRSRISSMSATERAQRDAKAVGSDILGLYVGGPFTTVQNQDFYRAFVAKIPANERGAFSRDGVLSKEGEDRMSAAILAAAYGDPQMLSRMLEDTDDNIKSITGAMRDSAGAFIRQKAAIASGQASPKFDITPQVSEVAKRIADLRDRGITPREFLAQMDAFTTVDPIVESLLVAFYNEKMSRQLSREKLTEILTRYANEATKHADGGLFEDTTKPKDIIGIARSRALEGERLALEQTDIFSASQGAALRGNAGDRGTGSGSGVDGRGQGSSQGQNPQALIEENTKPLDQITLPIDPAASNEQKLAQVARLTAENKPILDAQLKELDAELGTESNANTKKDATILEKASRPSILAKKPWHGVEHIRDTLRFQTKIDQFSQIETAVSKMLANGYSIVKVDTEKMLAPKEWGWRFAGLDLRAPNGQLIEWYLIFRSMYAAKKEGHKIFEKWRNETPETIEGRKEEYFQDIQRSFALYQGAFEDGLRASGYAGLEDAKADIAKLSASLPKTAAKLAAISSGTGGVNSDVQGASGPGLNTPMGPDSTRQRPVSSSSNTSGGLSGTGASFAFQSAQRPKIHVVKPISGQFSHDIETDAIESAYKAIGAGNTVVVTPSVVNRTLDVLRDMSASAPDGVGVGTIVKVRPSGGDKVELIVRLTDGRVVPLFASARAILGPQSARGFYVNLPDREHGVSALIVVTNYTDNLVVGSQLARISGTYVHETIHALRAQGRIEDVVWQRFVDHAYASGVLEMSFQRLQEANGGSPTNDKSSIGAFYTDFYERQPGATDEIVQERLDQEAAAHFAELATHGFWDADTLAPVQDILDGIESGAFNQVARGRELEDAAFAMGGRSNVTDALGYYSKAIEAARGLKQAKGTPEQMLAQLKAAGVKQAELDATGLTEFLQAKSARPEPDALNPEAEATESSRVLAETPEYKQAEAAAVKAFDRDLTENESRYFDTEYNDDGDSIPIDDDAKPSLYRSDRFSILPATVAAVEAGVTSIGFDLSLSQSVTSASRYGTIMINGEKKKVRVADHERQSSLHDRADFNIAPGGLTPFEFFEELISLKDRPTSTKKSAPTITRDAIVQHLEANRVEVKEVQYGTTEIRPGTRVVSREDWAKENGFDTSKMPLKFYAIDDDGKPLGGGSTYANAANLLLVKRAKWNAHSLDPSNPTYRETVLHLPEDKPSFEQFLKARQDAGYAYPDPTPDMMARYRAEYDAGGWRSLARGQQEAWRGAADSTFRSGHFPEPNIVGHLMTSMVKDADGRPVYLIDQIQSDWGQRLRDKGVRDEEKIARLEQQYKDAKTALDANELRWHDVLTDKEVTQADKGVVFADPAKNDLVSEHKALRANIELLFAELRTEKAATPGHPLVNTTDQWTNTTLRRAIRQAAEQGAHSIAIPSGDTVLSYNPEGSSGPSGMRGFYGTSSKEGIVPKNLRNLLTKIDKNSPKPTRVEKLDAPSKGMTNKGDLKISDGGTDFGFTVFELTDAVKRAVLDEGQPMFAFNGRTTSPNELSIQDKIANMDAVRGLISGMPTIDAPETRPLNDQFDMVVYRSGQYVRYDVVKKGEAVADADGNINSVGSYLVKPAQRLDELGVEVTNAALQEAYQRQGIGTTVYDAIAADFEAVGGVVPSPDDQLSDAAKAFWAQRRDATILKRRITNELGENEDGIPVRTERRLAGLDDQGSLVDSTSEGTAEGRSETQDVPGSGETSLEDGSESRDGVRALDWDWKDQVEAVKGRGWMEPEAKAERQKMQGWNVKGWHGTTRDFEIPDPFRGIFGYHVSIGTPRASNLRLGFGDNALERMVLKSAPKAADAQIQPVMVRAESQLRLPHFDWDNPKSWLKAVKAKRYAGSSEFRDYILANEASMPMERGEDFRKWIINALEASGHDSIIYKSRYEDAGRDSLFVWDARNVRSQLDLFDERAENDAGLTASRAYLRQDLEDLVNGLIEETVSTLPRNRSNGSMSTEQVFQAMLEPMYAVGGRKSLDSSPEARKARAEEMGFDTSKVWYHGTTKAGFSAFDPSLAGEAAGKQSAGLFFTENRRNAATYSGPDREAKISSDEDFDPRYDGESGIYSVYIKPGKQLVVDWGGNNWDEGPAGYTLDREAINAQKAGYDSLLVKNVSDEGPHGQGYNWGEQTLVVFDPKNIRSVNAMFDPDKSDSANIMYAFNGKRTSTEAERAALADKFDKQFAGTSAPALDKIITDLKQSIGLVTTQGLWGMTVRQETANPDGSTTVRQKRLRPSKRMRAMFRPSSGVISLRLSRDISAIAHEGGHALEQKLGDDLSTLKEAHRAVLEAQAYPGAQDKLSEGFAEWFKAYIVDGNHAKTVAPEFTEAFEDLVDSEMPGTLAQLIEVQSAYAAHIKLSPLQSLSNDLVSTYENNTWAELNEPGFIDSVPGRLSTAYTATIDALHPLNLMVRRLLEVADKNGVRDHENKPISVATHENPYKLSRLFADAYSRGRMWLENGIADYGSDVVASRSLHDAMTTLFKGEKWNKQTYKDFGAYLVSRRAVAEYDLLAQKQSALQQIDTTLDAVDKARPMVADRAAKDAAIAERRQNAVIREQTLLSDRRRQLSSARTQMQNLQVRLSDLIDDRDLGNTLANQTETASQMAIRRQRSIGIASRDASRMSREIEALELEVDEREVGLSMISNEAEQAQDAATASRQRVEQLDALTARLRKERAQRADLGASRPPTLQPREFHAEVIARVEADTPQFVEASKIVYEWTHQLLKVRRQAGFLTQEQFDVLAQRRDWYVPFQRDMSDVAPEAVFTGETGVKKWSPFKKFDGSDRAIINPLEVLSQQAYTTAQQVAFNDIVVSMSKLAERAGSGGGQIIETLTQATSAEANSATFDKIRNTAVALGIDPIDAHLIVQSMEQNFSDADVQLIWSPENKGPMALPTLPMWRNGERIMVRMPDPEFGKMVFDAVNGMGKEARNMLDRIGGGFSTALRVGVTTHPDFILGNLLRDIPAMFIIAGAIPGVAHAKGLYHYVKNTDTARLYNEAGGIMGGANVAATRKSDRRVDVLSLKNKGFTFELRKFWHIIEAVETAGRMGVFAHAMKQAKSHNPKLTNMQAAQEAAYVARDVIDFGRRGSKSAAMMRVVTFMNAHVQGMDKAQRLFKADSDRGSVMTKQIGLVLKRESGAPLSRNEERALGDAYKGLVRLTLFTAFALACVGMMWDDPEYKDIKDQTKNKHNWVKLWGQWTRWPLPFELALPTRYVEIIADKIAGRNEEMAKRLAASTFDALAPPIMPQILNLATGVVANHDNFRGRPIVGEHLQGLDPALRFDAYTSQLSIDMAKAVQATGVPRNWVPSPKMIDFLITSGGAYWGKEAQNIYSGGKKALGMSNREAWQWTDLPVVRRVTGVPAQQSRSIEGFYKLVGSSGGELSSAATSYKNYIDKQGQPEAAAVYLSRLQPEERAYAFLMQHRSADEKRSHPLERLKIADATLRDMRKEMILDTLTDKNRKGKREWDTKVVLSPAKQTEVHDILQKLGALETWNAMVLMKRPGWEDGKMYDPKPLEAVLKAASPDVYRILEARRAKAKMPDWDQVRRDWPKKREDLLKEAAKPL